MAKIQIDGVFKYFDDVQAVNNASFDIKDGEFFTLLGPSGCGKTTILRMIAGLTKPDRGNIYIENTLVNDFEPKDRDVGVVFQTYALYPHMSVFENIAFPLSARRMEKHVIERKVRHTAQLLQIEQLLNRKPKQLSGGQQQRVALGRAIVREPKAFLMDEPLSNLDAKLRVKMRGELKRLHKELGITTIYVTHDQEEAMTISDRIAILNHGTLQQISKPLDAYHNPVNKWVAEFIGNPAMNFFSSTLLHTEKISFCVLDGMNGYRFPLSHKGYIERLESGWPITLGVRPENMHLSKEEENGVPGMISVIEPLGDFSILEVMIGNEICSMKLIGEVRHSAGEKVRISFDQNKIYLFDRSNEANLLLA